MNETENIAQLENDLELDSGDQDTRVILADLYESIGDPIAETLRWMVDNSRRPCRVLAKEFSWSLVDCKRFFDSGLPSDVFELLKGSKSSESWKSFETCREATIELHNALCRQQGSRMKPTNDTQSTLFIGGSHDGERIATKCGDSVKLPAKSTVSIGGIHDRSATFEP